MMRTDCMRYVGRRNVSQFARDRAFVRGHKQLGRFMRNKQLAKPHATQATGRCDSPHQRKE